MKRILIIDGDEVAFRIASACETRSIKAIIDGEVFGEYKHRTEFKAWLSSEENELSLIFQDFEIEEVQRAEPVQFALNTVKQSIAGMMEACDADEYEIYLSGQGNFRDSIPLPKQYKGNRKDLLKPVLLKDIRKYIEKHHKGEVVNGYEVDDKLIIRCTECNESGDIGIAASQDKDARGCNIHLFNPVKGTLEYISGLGKLYLNDKGDVKGEGRKWLYFQWVNGDPTDYYKPCELAKVKYGEKSAYKILVDCETDEQCIKAVYDQYKKWYPEPVTYTAHDSKTYTKDCVEIMQMYMDCAHMRRWEDDVVDVKQLLIKFKIIEEQTNA